MMRIMAIWTKAKWVRMRFDVLGEASATVEPAEGALDDPALGQHDEAFGGLRSVDDLQ